MSENDSDNNQLNEPQAVYNKTVFGSFHSFEEANEANAKDMAAISGEVHLLNLTIRLEGYYANELKQPMDKKLKFRK